MQLSWPSYPIQLTAKNESSDQNQEDEQDGGGNGG